MSRVSQITDGGNGYRSFTYSQNDVLQTVGPAHLYKKQLEYDGLGQLTSVCEMSTTLSGTAACGQTSSQPSGFWTRYKYDGGSRLIGSCQNTTQPLSTDCVATPSAGQQTRTFTHDLLGRMTTESNPESGNTTYSYDADSVCGSSATSAGDLVKTVNNANTTTCFYHDALHRLISGGVTGGAICRLFVYDSATVDGVAMTNVTGRLAEAYTTNCSSMTLIVDEGFSYADNGQITDMYERTPNSGGYVHTTDSYYENGTLKTLTGVPGLAQTWTYGVNTEGRIITVSDNSGSVITGINYNAAGQPEGNPAITFVNGSDSFTHDNALRLNSFAYNVAGQTYSGTVSWNPNGTLGSLKITDPFYSTSGNCSYGYDDLVRVSSVNCLNGSTNVWNQTFMYDNGLSTGAFGNVSKSVAPGDPGQSFLVTYNNQNQIVGFNYDANGNMTGDGINTYQYDPNWQTVTSINSTTMSYDAFGRMVEANSQPILYSPVGRIGKLSAGSYTHAEIPTPAGRLDYITTSTYARLDHVDWLGSSRFMSDPHANTAIGAVAYAPFGEDYAKTSAMRLNFTDQFRDSEIDNVYDFPMRKNTVVEGRWLSPDPAGLAAVDLTHPQTFNKYGYVSNNPLNNVDPLGLKCFFGSGDDCGDPGSGGGLSGCPDAQIGDLCFPSDPGLPPGPIVPPDRGGQDGGGVAGGSTNGSAGEASGGVGNGERLGIPNGLPLPTGNILDLLNINPAPGCEFGVCVTIGNGFEDAESLGLAAPICVAQPELCVAGIIGIGIVIYGPQIIQTVKDIAHTTGSVIDPYNQFLKDLKACTERYAPGPDRDECYKQARDKFRRATGRGPIN
jgi:RHS repeat-associated protein